MIEKSGSALRVSGPMLIAGATGLLALLVLTQHGAALFA